MFGIGKYQYRTDKTYMVFTFESKGPHGVIQKIARFTKIGNNVYNFGFGDFDLITGNISDTVTSNNGDIEIIMGTLGSIVYDFTTLFMDALIIVQGTNTARTRLYQMNINKHWARINSLYDVSGLRNGKWEPFLKIVNYEMIAGKRKSTNDVTKES